MSPHAVIVACLLTAAGLAAASRAGAQSPDIVKAQAGEWLVAPDDGRPGCRIRLKTDKTIGGMVATPASDCRSRVPALADVAAWHMADGVTLSDATRKPVLVFAEDETTVLKTRGRAPPAYYMFRPGKSVDRVPHASAIFGTWQMRRPNGPVICTLALRDRPEAGGQENRSRSYGLELGPACDAAIKRLKLVSWRIEDLSLMLYGGDGEGLRFAQTATGFEKVTSSKSDRPLLLARQP